MGSGVNTVGRVLAIIAGVLVMIFGAILLAGGAIATLMILLAPFGIAIMAIGGWYLFAGIMLIVGGGIGRSHPVAGGILAIIFGLLSFGAWWIFPLIMGIIGGILILVGREKEKRVPVETREEESTGEFKEEKE